MPAAIQISVRENARKDLREMIDRTSGQHVNEVAGHAAANVMRDWFRTINSSRANSLGGQRTNFFSEAADATGVDVDDDGAVVYTQQIGVLYQRFGGTIKPSGRTSSVTGKAIVHLAIPARAEAHGLLPSDFGDLVPVFRRRGSRSEVIGLAEPYAQAVSYGKHQRKDGTRKVIAGDVRGGGILFWLVKSATKSPDPGVLPPEELIDDEVMAQVSDFVARSARRSAA